MSEFNAGQLRFIDWLAASKYERSPTTEALLARELGIADRTLRRWKLLPGFKQAIRQRAREYLGDDIPEVYAALRREAIKGNFHHIKLALELTGEYTDKVRIEDWRSQLVELYQQGQITKEQIINEFADAPSLIEELFNAIGLRAIEIREAQSQSAEVE